MLQIMGALTGCVTTCKNTGLINTGERPDIYTRGHEVMATRIDIGNYPRSVLKDAIMTYFYGSERQPKLAFGDGTLAHRTFLEVVDTIAPGAQMMRDALMSLWNPNASSYLWVLPDLFHASFKVMVEEETEHYIPELGIKYMLKKRVNKPTEHGVALVANPTHSVDAFILREMERSCNYSEEQVRNFLSLERIGTSKQRDIDKKLLEMLKVISSCGYVSLRILDFIDKYNIGLVPTDVYKRLVCNLQDVLEHKPFDLLTTHDCFRALPNNMNHVRKHYIEIMAQLAESTLLEHIVSFLVPRRVTVNKLSDNLGAQIRQCEYPIS